VRVGFDIGGTFTDVIVLGDDGKPHVAKVLSLLEQVGADIASFVREVPGGAGADVFVHGTTIASNAVIEGNTARTGLLTTRGFRDELEMRGQRRPNIYDVQWNRLPPLVPRALRLEVGGRMLGDGSEETPIDLDGAREAVERLVRAEVEAVAVAFVNSYLNPAHERALGALIAEIAPGLNVCLSSDIHPEIREYERTSTTVINASLVPVVARYLDRLESDLATFEPRVSIMQSNGGVMSSALARDRPALMIESGPAAGVLAAARLASENDWPRVLSFDMGGTTAKACLIEGGVPLEKAGGEVGAATTTSTRLFGGGGHVLRVPWLDIVEVGAGGGSLAWVDEGGALRVGPRSAGAEPGPACYGRGGTQPTVTDANVVLGYMNPGAIAGSTLTLDREAAYRSIDETIVSGLNMGVLDAAHGICQVANATMMRALRAVSTERGRDPRGFTLVPFGGAGPMHAAALAETLGITEIRVPVYPGLFSALGLLMAEYRQDYVTSVARRVEDVSPAAVHEMLNEMERSARADMAVQGVGEDDLQLDCAADLRYGYQVSELTVPLPELGPALAEALLSAFSQAHLLAYGYQRDDPVELVNLRMRARAAAPSARFADLAVTLGDHESVREVYFGREHGLVETPVLGRGALTEPRAGPLIVEEADTTVVVPPGWSVALGEGNHLSLTR